MAWLDNRLVKTTAPQVEHRDFVEPAPRYEPPATHDWLHAGLSPIQAHPLEVRRACATCGTHTFMLPHLPGSGRCGNCGGVHLTDTA